MFPVFSPITSKWLRLWCCIQGLSGKISLCSASDGWAFKNNIDIDQHRSLEDRLAAAQILVQEDPLCPVVVDDMNNSCSIKYGAMPERLYVLRAGKVTYKVRRDISPPSWSCDRVSTTSSVGLKVLSL